MTFLDTDSHGSDIGHCLGMTDSDLLSDAGYFQCLFLPPQRGKTDLNIHYYTSGGGDVQLGKIKIYLSIGRLILRRGLCYYKNNGEPILSVKELSA